MWLGSALAGYGAGTKPVKPVQSVPLCAGVTLSASYLAAVAPTQEPGFRFTLSNQTSHEIKLAQPVPSSSHWYARSKGRWLWRASNGGGGGLMDASSLHGRLAIYPSADRGAGPVSFLIVPPHQAREWVASQEENPVLAYNPGCKQCSYPGEREYQVVFAYAYLAGSGDGEGLLACGVRSLAVPMPPKF